MSIGDRLREEREKIGYSQEKLASIGGVKKGAQINYEAGKRQPDAAYLRGISQVGIDLQYVLIGLRSANLMEAMLSDEFVEETSVEHSIGRSQAQVQASEEQLLLLAFRRCSPESRGLLLNTAALLSAGMTTPVGAKKVAKKATQPSLSVGTVHGQSVQGTVTNNGPLTFGVSPPKPKKSSK